MAGISVHQRQLHVRWERMAFQYTRQDASEVPKCHRLQLSFILLGQVLPCLHQTPEDPCSRASVLPRIAPHVINILFDTLQPFLKPIDSLRKPSDFLRKPIASLVSSVESGSDGIESLFKGIESLLNSLLKGSESLLHGSESPRHLPQNAARARLLLLLLLLLLLRFRRFRSPLQSRISPLLQLPSPRLRLLPPRLRLPPPDLSHLSPPCCRLCPRLFPVRPLLLTVNRRSQQREGLQVGADSLVEMLGQEECRRHLLEHLHRLVTWRILVL
mmetsp:Transcript_48834/g.122300  ORF Transcript_48834/g.122300 Transcript_48834/m.122300 type:complete len:272 (+) Transcript_48834:1154-1969(+)